MICMGIFPSRAKSRRGSLLGISVGFWDNLRGARQLGAERRATYLYSVDPRDLDHDAGMRNPRQSSGAVGPFYGGLKANRAFGSPPPRVVIGDAWSVSIRYELSGKAGLNEDRE